MRYPDFAQSEKISVDRGCVAKQFLRIICVLTAAFLILLLLAPVSHGAVKTYHTDTGGTWTCGSAILGLAGVLTDSPTYNCTNDSIDFDSSTNYQVLGTWISNTPYSRDTQVKGDQLFLWFENPGMMILGIIAELGYSTDGSNFQPLGNSSSNIYSNGETIVPLDQLSGNVQAGAYLALRIWNVDSFGLTSLVLGTGINPNGYVRLTVEEAYPCSDPVTGLVERVVTSSSVELTWEEAFRADEYRIYRDGDPTIFATVTEPEFLDDTVMPNTTYQYDVRGYNIAEDCENQSSTLTVVTKPATVNPGTFDFIDVSVGESELATFSLLSELASDSLEVASVTISGPRAAHFTVTNDNCSGNSLSPGTGCMFDITFAPTSDGSSNAAAVIAFNTSGMQDVLIPLTGGKGPYIVRDISKRNGGIDPVGIVEINGTLFFSAFDDLWGRELWKSDGTEGGTVRVKDIYEGSGSSSPENLTNVNGTLYFTANDSIFGKQLWKSDGTEGGTIKVKNIHNGPHGSSPSDLININGTLFFSADDYEKGRELWKSDGTEAGTVRVKDIYEGSGDSSPQYLTVMNGLLYFQAHGYTQADGTRGVELWKSDGTESGTVRIKDIYEGSGGSSPQYLTVMNGLLYFQAHGYTQADGDSGRELWESDGTEGGTVRVKDIYEGSGGSYPGSLTVMNGLLYFRARDYSQTDDSSGTELWKSDGTEAGTLRVKDIYEGSGNSYPESLTVMNGLLYFMARDYSQSDDTSSGLELWKSDGTEAGTVRVKDIYEGSTGSSPEYLTEMNGMLYFQARGFTQADGSRGAELWKSDGTEAGTVRVKDIYEGNGGSNPQYLTNISGTLYFSAFDPLGGRELWKSDGTEDGTECVNDFLFGNGGSSLNNFVRFDGKLFFKAGPELWMSDGTESGTVRIKEFSAKTGLGFIDHLTTANGMLFFTASDNMSGIELWKSDGTEAGTVRVKDIYEGSEGSNPQYLTVMGGILYFQARGYSQADGDSGHELWKSDGTEAGTMRVKDIYEGSGNSSPQYLTVMDNMLYFQARGYTQADDTTSGYELWKSDGTEAGTVRVKDIYEGSGNSYPQHLREMNGMLYFQARGYTQADGTKGYELWKSDGTEAGTVRVKDIYEGSGGSYPAYLTVINGVLYFRAKGFTQADGSKGVELWKSDGTEAGTVKVKDIYEGGADSHPAYLTVMNGVLYFKAHGYSQDDGDSGYELWKSDGTESGTVRVKDIYEDNGSSSPSHITNVNGRLFFRANDGLNGNELWTSDGTEAGTYKIEDIRIGNAGSEPSGFLKVDETLFFAADDGDVGRELWAMSVTNEAPSITPIDDQDTFDNNPVGPLSFIVSDSETPSNELLVFATSNNQELLPDANIVLAGDSENRTITLTPALNQTGTAIVSVTVDDGTLTATNTFELEWWEAVVVGPVLGGAVEQTTIQAGIDAAISEGVGVVVITNGTYTGSGNKNIILSDSVNITIQSESGPEETIIDLEYNGRAFVVESSSTVTLDGLTIKNGYESDGGAIYINSNTSDSLDIKNCIFQSNFAFESGGAIYGILNTSLRTLLINNTVFHRNSSIYDGGAISATGMLEIVSCSFSQNSGKTGGGIALIGNNSIIKKSRFYNNNAVDGGALYSGEVTGEITVDGCIFSKNSAEKGGAITSYGADNITNSIFSKNTSFYHGGAIINVSSYPDFSQLPTNIYHCTFSDNEAKTNGGAVYAMRSLNLVSSIFWRNKAGGLGDQIRIIGYTQVQNTIVNVDHSNIEGGLDGIYDPSDNLVTVNSLGGNIDQDPIFALKEDFHLMPDSPCIDAGNNNPSRGLPETDLEGNPRPLPGSVDSLQVADMGAYEFDRSQTHAAAISPEQFIFKGRKGGALPDAQSLIIRSRGAAPFNWTINEEIPWLRTDATEGRSTGEANNVDLYVDHSNLVHGTYTGSLKIINNLDSKIIKTVKVTLHVTSDLHVPSSYPTIQAAIDESIDGDVVVVADGSYTGPGNMNISYRGKYITVRSENGPQYTTINCDTGCDTNNDGTCDSDGDGIGEGRAFIFLHGESASSILQGLTIMNGRAIHDSYSYLDGKGGGILIGDNSSATILNCVFDNNVAGLWGGGIFSTGNYNTVRSSTFTNNKAENGSGGGIYSSGSFFTIDKSTFIGNLAQNQSGAYFAGHGGGICFFVDTSVDYGENYGNNISNSEFRGNVAEGLGAGVLSWGATFINNSIFSHNIASRDGGVGTHAGSVVANSLFYENRARNADNTAGECGGMFASLTEVVNCTFANNYAHSSGAGLCGNEVTVTNSIFWNNFINNSSLSDLTGPATVSYSTISDTSSWPADPDKHIINEDPQFLDPDGADDVLGNADDDFRLDPASPCIDRGKEIQWLFSDIRGSLRPVEIPNMPRDDAGDPIAQKSAFDIGAYEYSAYLGGLPGDMPAKAFKEVKIKSSMVVTNFEYPIEWKDRDPFPFDSRIDQAEEYTVNIALVSKHGLRVDLGTYRVPVTQQGYSFLYTFGSEHIGSWRIRVELASDPNQFALSDEITIQYKEGTRYAFGQWIKPPEGADPDQKPEVDDPHAVYWSVETNRLYGIAPVTTVITWYADEQKEIPIPVVAYITSPDQENFPEDPDTRIHIADSMPVELLPAGTRFDLVDIMYSGSGATISANQFTAGAEGWSVLMFRDDQAEDPDEKEKFDIVRTYMWDHVQDPDKEPDWILNPAFPFEATCYIGAEITDTDHDTTCGNGYVFFGDARYDGYGENSAHDRDTRQGPVFAVNRDLSGPIENDPESRQDDLVVVWYEKSTASGVCWPSKPVRYDPMWPTDPKKIVIASQQGSGPLDPLAYGLLEDMVVYNQPDRSLPGYNPNEEHATFFTAQGSEHPAVFALRNDLNRPNTSEPYALLKYRHPVTGQWLFEVYKVVVQSERYFLGPTQVIPDPSGNGPRYYIDEQGGLKERGLRYAVNKDGLLVDPLTPQRFFNIDGGVISPAAFTDALTYHLDGNGLLMASDSPPAVWYYLDNQGRLRNAADTLPAWYNFDGNQIVSITDPEEAKRYFLTAQGELRPAASYYLDDQGRLVNPKDTTKCYNLNAGLIEPLVCIPEEQVKLYHIAYSNNEWRIVAHADSPPVSAYSLDAHGVIVDRDIYYRFQYSGTAGNEINPPYPLNQLAFGPCSESYINENSEDQVLKDKDDKMFARSGGINGETVVDISLHYFYRMQTGFFLDFDDDGFTDIPIGTCIPWLEGLDATFESQTPGQPGVPVKTTYAISWPDPVPSLFVGETLTDTKKQEGEAVGLPNIKDQCIVEILFDQSVAEGGGPSVKLIDPLYEYAAPYPTLDPESELPQELKPERGDGGRWVFTALPYHIQSRLTYDPYSGEAGELKFRGTYQKETGEAMLLMNRLTDWEMRQIAFVFEPDATEDQLDNLSPIPASFRAALNDLRSQGGEGLQGYQKLKFAEIKALTAGDAQGTGYVTLAFNNDPDCMAPTGLSVIRVGCPLYRGEVKVIESPNVFEEKVTLRHNGDFGGLADHRWFQWKYLLTSDFPGKPDGPGTNGENWQSYNAITPSALSPRIGDDGYPFSTGEDPYYRGAVDITVQGSGQQLLTDKWFSTRYFCDGVCAPGNTSKWTKPQLYEGWIKRVMKNINLFDQKIKEYHEAAPSTLASMISLAGRQYEDEIALSDEPEYLQNLGIIEVYETLLKRGRSLSIDGSPAVPDKSLDMVLLFAANRIADINMLLGNEAYADATDPTIGFSTENGIYGTEAPSIFCFQNQTATLLDEELSLLRGLDDYGASPFYNRLIWNFTLGDGEVAYKENYNITDQITEDTDNDTFSEVSDGLIDYKDAMVQYPQGHGDAWGYYLTATKTYYELLTHPIFTWYPESEAILVGQAPVIVDYRDERKFASAAAAKAKTGSEIVNLTYRQFYTEDPEGQWQGYKDLDPERAWGVAGWASRAGQGAFFDWVVGNAIIPSRPYKEEQHIAVNGQTVFTLGAISYLPGMDNILIYVNGEERGPAAYDETSPTEITFTTGLDEGDQVLFRVPSTETGLSKVDRTTVLELGEIAGYYGQIQAKVDEADAGLNPLGLAKAVLPFDIDPGRVENGETHFEQVYNRAVQSMNNAIAVFNHANQSTQLLRRQHDSLADFQRNIENSEADFNNRLIEMFGYPYTDDCGPGKTYPSDYCETGPDLFHYMYVDPSEYMGVEAPEVHHWVQTFRNITVDATGALQEEEVPVTLHVATDGRFGLIKPPDWLGRRKAPGEIQIARSDILQTRIRFEKALKEYDNLLGHIDKQAELIETQYGVNAKEIKILETSKSKQESLNSRIKRSRKKQLDYRGIGRAAVYLGNAIAEGFPGVVGFIAGLANGAIVDALSGLRAAAKNIGAITNEIMNRMADVESLAELDHQQAKEIESAKNNIKLTTLRGGFAIEQQLLQLENLVRSEATLRDELYVLAESLKQSAARYLSALARGERLIADRLRFRKQTAAQIVDYRYKDMTFRIFRNDALEKYRAQFDLAARYVYLAAKAYDYETTLFDYDSMAGQHFLNDIVKQRTIGMIEGGQPLTGSGLADPMKRMWQNFQVLKPQLGFNNPQQETNRFSLRKELFRVRMDEDSNETWQQVLENYRVEDLWTDDDYNQYFRRYCRPFASEGIPQPGIVIPLSTTVTSGLNFFKWPLGGGDSYYSATNFATKVRSVGVWFSNYNSVHLAETPRVYLVPVGEDVLRTPSFTDEIRTWQVIDQKLPMPFPIVATEMANNSAWIPTVDTLFDEMFQIRRHSDFRAYHDSGYVNESEMTFDSRLVGRSVWNSRWLLIIPGRNLLYDPDEGVERFIYGPKVVGGDERTGNGVSDIKLFFHTYAYSGN